jgi:hypothetical protein
MSYSQVHPNLDSALLGVLRWLMARFVGRLHSIKF